jgi:hypothetical protein
MQYNFSCLDFTSLGHYHVPFLSDVHTQKQQQWSDVDSANQSIRSRIAQTEQN